MRDGHDEAPINPLPAVVWLLLLPMVAIEVVLGAGSVGLAGGAEAIGWRNEAIQRFALSPMMLDQMLATGRFNADFGLRFLSYPFVHGSVTHAIFVAVFILALGKMVGEVFRAWAVVVVFLAAGIVGGLVYSLVPGITAALFGGYPPVYGLIGAFTFILWARLGAVEANRMRAFTLIGLLMGLQLLFGLLFGGRPDWIADLAGFVAGFALSFVLGPGGPAQMLRLIRQR